jgi:cathepsin L
VDWRERGAVTRVRDQLYIPTCWVFAAAGALEAVNFIQNGILVELDESTIFDPSILETGQNGGFILEAWDYVREFNYIFPGITIGENMSIEYGNEQALMEAVSVQPVAAVIRVTRGVQAYRGGIYTEHANLDDERNLVGYHAILIVGYGTDRNGEEFWIVKNSWGTEWGEGGYMRLARNRNNQLGIASYAVYPRID